MSVHELILERLKRGTRPVVNPVTDTVGTTATKILLNNPDRFSWLVVNLSADRGYLGWDPTVGAAKGVPIEANGGTVSMYWQEDGEVVCYELYAVNEVASGKYIIVELETL